ncbi:MAG: hypothetical protein AAFN30_02700, partial [Actinomycetota bacterium]
QVGARMVTGCAGQGHELLALAVVENLEVGGMEPFADARKEIEATSNRLHAADFEVLDDSEREEFVALASAARDHAGANLRSDSTAAIPS